MRNLFVGCAIVALASSAAYAQETTSTIRGTVMSAGAPVANAKVTVVHTPSGTKSVVATDSAGAFAASGLRPGGPYTVTVNAAGYGDYSVTDINTVVSQSFELPIQLAPQAATSAPEIVVSASRVRGARNVSLGPSTVLTADKISQVASVNRDIRDLMRRDPFANLDTSSSSGRNVSFAGQNPRFNRFTIDGVPITDSFGLNPDALPSRRGPVPLDSIGQFETKVAPYDIREGFFQGGVVNAILKSGTNEFHGTGFYTLSSDKLQGDQSKPYIGITDPSGKIPVPKYKSRDFGATISGPILKDRLFFMVSAERVRASVPLPYGTVETNSGSAVAGLSDATFNEITSIAQSKYGVKAGGILRNNGDKDDRIVGRIDANVSETQRLSFTGIYTKDSLLTPGTTSNTSLSTESDDYVKPNRVLAGVVQLNSDWSDKISTEARVLYKDYQSGQTPLLSNSAMATICTDRASPAAIANGTYIAGTSATSCTNNSPSVIVGPQGSSQANILHVKTFEASLVTRFTFGDHRVRLLLDGQNSNNYNLFVNGALGTYYFDSIDAFKAGKAQTFSYTNAPSGNANDAAARFTYQTITTGLQDDWKVNRKLSLSYGVRWDLFGGDTHAVSNPFFIQREGFPNNYFINGKSLIQPRIGFDYAPTQRLSFHGGGGIFGGGTPDVYIGNSFSNSGILPGSITNSVNSTTGLGGNAGFLNNVNLTSIPSGANAALAASTTASTAAIARNFKVPSQWRATLSANYRANLGALGDGWNFGTDVLFSKVRDALFIQDLRNRPISGANALTPDGRQRYYDVTCNTPATTVCADPNGDYVLGDTGKGRSWVLVGHFDKAWDFGLSVSGSFTYQDVKDQQAFTSSVASSNYNNGAYLDANGGAYGHSNDEVRYSFKYSVSYDHAFFRDYKTRFSIFGETRIGSPYSYTFRDPTSSGSNRSSIFGTVGTNTHYLFYVPTGPSDPLAGYADAATQTAIENLINSTDLKKYRGKIAPRNAFNSKWFTKLDLHVEQEIPTFVGHSRITVFADIENFLNLLDHNWGQQLRANFPYNKVVADVSCVKVGANSCGKYLYSNPTSSANLADQFINTSPGASLYSIRVGARFTF